jgi:hypothetical protein
MIRKRNLILPIHHPWPFPPLCRILGSLTHAPLFPYFPTIPDIHAWLSLQYPKLTTSRSIPFLLLSFYRTHPAASGIDRRNHIVNVWSWQSLYLKARCRPRSRPTNLVQRERKARGGPFRDGFRGNRTACTAAGSRGGFVSPTTITLITVVPYRHQSSAVGGEG